MVQTRAMKRQLDDETPSALPVKKPAKKQWTIEMAKKLQEETVQKYIEKRAIKEGSAELSLKVLTDSFREDHVVFEDEDLYTQGCYETVYYFLCDIYKALHQDGKPVYITEKALWECMSLNITSTRNGLDKVVKAGKVIIQPCGTVEFTNTTSEFLFDLACTLKPLLALYTGQEFEQLSPLFGPIKTVPFCFGYHLQANNNSN